MELYTGDEVEFITNGIYIPNEFYSEYLPGEIPEHLIKHGSTIYKENKGEIIAIYKDYYIVKYISDLDRVVQLGFKKEVLKKISKSQTIKNQTNEQNNKINNSSIKVQRPIEQISRPVAIRGIGLKGSGSKIKLGSNSSYNKERFSCCKA